MKAFITLCALLASAYFAFQNTNLKTRLEGAESHIVQLTEQRDQLAKERNEFARQREELERLQAASPTKPKNWREEKTEQWGNRLGAPSYDNRPAVSPYPYTRYYDSGGYYIDQYGNRVYGR